MLIQLDKINPPKFNSRVEKKTKDAIKVEGDALERLRISLLTKGQEQPIKVSGPNEDGTYDLVFGNRRRCAAIAAGWAEIDATVVASTNQVEDNIIENLVREDLTTFEKARSAAILRYGEDLKSKGKSLKDTAEVMGQAQSYVSKLATAYKGLPPQVLTEWENGHEAAEVNKLLDIADAAKYPTVEAQVREWDAHAAEYAKRKAKLEACKHDFTPSGKCRKCGHEKRSSSPGYSLNQKACKLAISVLKSSKVPENSVNTGSKKDARDLLDFLIGQRKTAPDWLAVFVPKEETEDDADDADAAE